MTLATQIMLDNEEFEGYNNAYLLESTPETALIDTGISNSSTRESLVSRLNEEGVDIADLDMIFLTHWHPDHAGLAGELQRLSGATVYTHPDDAQLVARDEDAVTGLNNRQRSFFELWGIPQPKRDELQQHLNADNDISGSPVDVTSVSDRANISVGNTDLQVFHTPGHTAGHVCYEYRTGSSRELFAGDALLPKYTPNVGGTDVRVGQPLETYLKTLERLCNQDSVPHKAC